jgi:hypothetical protein
MQVGRESECVFETGRARERGYVRKRIHFTLSQVGKVICIEDLRWPLCDFARCCPLPAGPSLSICINLSVNVAQTGF